jgi:methanogenic corrinoid protein MtbC1
MNKGEILRKLTQAVLEGDEEKARKAAQEAVEARVDYLTAIKEGIGKGMEEVGKAFEDLRMFLPDLIKAGEAGKVAIAVLKSLVPKDKLAEVLAGKIVLGAISGDVHDIGKNIVSALLTAGGFDVYDIGIDQPARAFIDKAREVNADIIAISCLLTPSLYYEKDVLQELRETSMRNKYYIVIGGGATTPDWARQIGVDAWGLHAEDGPLYLTS